MASPVGAFTLMNGGVGPCNLRAEPAKLSAAPHLTRALREVTYCSIRRAPSLAAPHQSRKRGEVSMTANFTFVVESTSSEIPDSRRRRELSVRLLIVLFGASSGGLT